MYFALAENDALLANAQAAKNEEEVEEEDSGYEPCLMDYMGEKGEWVSHVDAQMNAELRVEDRALRKQRLRRRRRRQQRLEENTASANVAVIEIQVENTAMSLDVADIQVENTAIIAAVTTCSTTIFCIDYTLENQEDRASLRQRKQRLCLAEGNAALLKMEEERALRRDRRRTLTQPLRPIKTAAEGLERRRLGRGMNAKVDIQLRLLAKLRRNGQLYDPVSSETEVGEELERILFRNLGERSEKRLLEYCHRTRANHRNFSRFYKRNYGARALKRELEELWEPNGRIPGEPSCWDPNVVSPGVVCGETYAHCFGEKKRKREYFTRPFPPQSSGSSGSDESEPEPPPWTPPLDPSVC